MLDRIRPKLTYANVVASLALFVALGGSAYAVGVGAIGSREIRDGSIRSADVRNNTLTGRDVDERTLRASPRVYVRTQVTPITLSPAGNSATASCDRGDTAISGKENGDGDQLTFRGRGNLQSKSTYLGTIYGELGAAGQRRSMFVTVVCLAHARR